MGFQWTDVVQKWRFLLRFLILFTGDINILEQWRNTGMKTRALFILTKLLWGQKSDIWQVLAEGRCSRSDNKHQLIKWWQWRWLQTCSIFDIQGWTSHETNEWHTFWGTVNEKAFANTRPNSVLVFGNNISNKKHKPSSSRREKNKIPFSLILKK